VTNDAKYKKHHLVGIGITIKCELSSFQHVKQNYTKNNSCYVPQGLAAKMSDVEHPTTIYSPLIFIHPNKGNDTNVIIANGIPVFHI